MSEVYFKFKLPEEKDEFTLSHKGGDCFFVVHDLDQFLRGCQKYHHNFQSADDAVDKMREHLHSLMDGWGISIDMVK